MQAKDDASLAELLPCPFCGGEAVTFRSMLPSPINECWGVVCWPIGKCQAGIDCQATEAAAIAAWNRRQQSGEAVEPSPPVEPSPVDVERVAKAGHALIANLNGYAARLSGDTIAAVRHLHNALAALQSPPVEQPAQAEGGE